MLFLDLFVKYSIIKYIVVLLVFYLKNQEVINEKIYFNWINWIIIF